jgi:hypothetical protein
LVELHDENVKQAALLHCNIISGWSKGKKNSPRPLAKGEMLVPFGTQGGIERLEKRTLSMPTKLSLTVMAGCGLPERGT